MKKMDKYEELAQAIVDYEMVGYYNLIDAYDTPENALECITDAIRSGEFDLADLCIEYSQAIAHENLSDEARELARRAIRLADGIARDRFVGMVNTYRALGYRIVEFEPPYQKGYGSSSWICAFDTHGISADEIPIESFANEFWLNDLRNYANWHGPVSEVWHADVTDDWGEMLGGYDYFGLFPVMQLCNMLWTDEHEMSKED